jgi:hypothetical protein
MLQTVARIVPQTPRSRIIYADENAEDIGLEVNDVGLPAADEAGNPDRR